MKTYLRMKKRFTLCCTLAFLMALLSIPLSVQAEEDALNIPLYHKHIASCEEVVYRTSLVDGVKRSTTTHSAPCSCGGTCDYYSFYAKCSCGASWYTTGHACVNSIYGANRGSCSNVGILNTDTTHMHPFRDYVCGYTEESVIETIIVEKDTYLPATCVNLYAYAKDNMYDACISWGSESEGSVLTVTENGSYPLYITYSENDIEYVTETWVEVNHIDKEMPVIGKLCVSETEFVSGDIVLSIEAEDDYGLPENCISWNGGAFGPDREYTIAENGIYEVVVQDYAGNKVSQSIEVNNIDKAEPDITGVTIEPAPWYEGSCKVMITATDEGSGLCASPFSLDEGNTWGGEGIIVLDEPGSVTVWVKDNVGNICKETYEIAHHTRPTYSGGSTSGSALPEGEQADAVETEDAEDSETASEKTDGSHGTDERVAENVQMEGTGFEVRENGTDVKVEIVESEPVEYETAQTGEDMQTLSKDDSKRKNLTIVFWTVSVILGSGICIVTGGMLFVLFGLCRVYEADENGHDKFLGSVGIRKGKSGYVTTIGSNVVLRAKSRNLKMKIPSWFVKNCRYKQLKIKVGKQNIDRYVEKEVRFTINM